MQISLSSTAFKASITYLGLKPISISFPSTTDDITSFASPVSLTQLNTIPSIPIFIFTGDFLSFSLFSFAKRATLSNESNNFFVCTLAFVSNVSGIIPL